VYSIKDHTEKVAKNTIRHSRKIIEENIILCGNNKKNNIPQEDFLLSSVILNIDLYTNNPVINDKHPLIALINKGFLPIRRYI